ncbi:helix-turn-helix domain-containing protein [Siminovitchia sp. 179-K 8D1 HS]|uniref:helix-turn-helix domain-containing protein n=1 Tax=Siminovitchia sp. 179-K 8D1 HS TaxID=3142385 RepID=UPI00399FAB2F
MNANKVKAIRHYLGLSMAEFAKRLGVSVGTVCIIEQGGRDVSDYVRAKLARLEMELDDDFYLFMEKFNQNTPS